VQATAIWYFLATVAITLVVTAWAGRRTTTRADYYAAGERITGLQNGFAIAGDFLGAAAVLGIMGLYFVGGVDILIYFLCPLIGLMLMLLLTAERLRRLGRFTFGDVLIARIGTRSVRAYAGISTIVVAVIYLVVQLIGAGILVAAMFGLSFEVAVVMVGILMALYVAVGGMLATTWVQIIKAGLLIAAILVLSILCLVESGGFAALYERAASLHKLGSGLFQPGGLHLSAFGAASLSAGLIFGMVGLPHLLTRFFTVPDETAARRSVVIACMIIGLVFALLFAIIGPGTVAFVAHASEYRAPDGAILGGNNMVAMHLASALGGPVLYGMTSAVAFATILAVVTGLTIAAASAASHDLYTLLSPGYVKSERRELAVFRTAALLVAATAVTLAIVFQHENIAVLTVLVFSVAASTNFPVLILALYWQRTTAFGVWVGGAIGFLASVSLIVLGPAVWVNQLGHAKPLFAAEYPALVSVPLAFAAIIVASLLSKRHAHGA